MPFHWPLQRLLDVTDKRELGLKAELFGISRRIAGLHEEIRRRGDMLRLLLDDLAECDIEQRSGLQELLMRCRKIERGAIRDLHEQADELSSQREGKKADLAKIMAKKETLQNLRQEAKKKHDRLVSRREQRRLDEAFQVRFARNMRDKLKLKSA